MKNFWFGCKVVTVWVSEIAAVASGFTSFMSLLTGDWKVGILTGAVAIFCAYMTRSLVHSLIKEEEINTDLWPPDDGCAA